MIKGPVRIHKGQVQVRPDPVRKSGFSFKYGYNRYNTALLFIKDLFLPPIVKETKMTSINLTDKAVKDFDFLFHGSTFYLLGMMYDNLRNQGVQQRGR